MSTAFFQEREDEAIIFRGPMIHNTILQFLQMTDWGDLDYLIADMPPGTSDAALTVMQTVPLDGFVVQRRERAGRGGRARQEAMPGGVGGSRGGGPP
jgi:Mrp family chromosome partitioning ATPase